MSRTTKTAEIIQTVKSLENEWKKIGKRKPQADLPSGIQLLTNLSDKRRLGEEITLATLDRITYEPDGWL